MLHKKQVGDEWSLYSATLQGYGEPKWPRRHGISPTPAGSAPLDGMPLRFELAVPGRRTSALKTLGHGFLADGRIQPLRGGYRLHGRGARTLDHPAVPPPLGPQIQPCLRHWLANRPLRDGTMAWASVGGRCINANALRGTLGPWAPHGRPLGFLYPSANPAQQSVLRF
jgi:hypothetical protein